VCLSRLTQWFSQDTRELLFTEKKPESASIPTPSDQQVLFIPELSEHYCRFSGDKLYHDVFICLKLFLLGELIVI